MQIFPKYGVTVYGNCPGWLISHQALSILPIDGAFHFYFGCDHRAIEPALLLTRWGREKILIYVISS